MSPRFRTENSSPYSLFGDYNGDYKAGTFTLGGHTLTATPFSGTNAGGTAGTALSISFPVMNQSNVSSAMSIDIDMSSTRRVNPAVATPSTEEVVRKHASRRASLGNSIIAASTSFDSQTGNGMLISKQPLVSQRTSNKAVAFFTELGEKRSAKAIDISDDVLALAFESFWPALL